MHRLVHISLLISGIALLGPVRLPAREGSDIPPPAAAAPERIKIPLDSAYEPAAAGGDEEEAEGELAALNLAAAGQGYVPAGSSGILRNGMQIRVTVMIQGQVELATEPQRINESGNIGLPLLKNFYVANQSLEDVEKNITASYKDYYRDPLVNVEYVGSTEDPSSSPWGYVTLMGNVGSPGPLAVPPTGNLTVSGALKKAGGASASAKKGSISIYRPLPEENSVERIRVDLDDLAKKGRHREDIQLRPGDVVYVPERVF